MGLASRGPNGPTLLGGLLLSGDGALRSLAGARVGLGALTANGQTTAMTLTLVAVDLDLATNVGVDFTTQIAFDLVVGFQIVTQRDQLLIGEILDADVRVDAGGLKGLLGAGTTDTENIGEGDLDALLIGDVDSGKRSCTESSGFPARACVPGVQPITFGCDSAPDGIAAGIYSQPWRCLWRGLEQITMTRP